MGNEEKSVQDESQKIDQLSQDIAKAKQAYEAAQQGENEGGSMGALRVGAEMVGGVAGGGMIGYGLDYLFGTSPLLLILCLCFGFAASLVNIYRISQQD